MRTARKLQPETIHKNKNVDDYAALRRLHFSVHEAERREAIDLLGTMADADAARELILLFGDCEWRTTRFTILRTLGGNKSQRSLEFLFRIARDTKDISLAEAAIWALGQTHHPMAARFLTHYYLNCSDVFKPVIAGAIGQIPDHNLAATLLGDLKEALSSGQMALLRNLVLTLGELRYGPAISTLKEIAAQRANQMLSLSAIISLGKIARDPSVIEPLESLYSRDLFEYQIFSGALAQVRFRAQWTLEDYLQKLFDGPAIDSQMALELNAFPAEKILAGFEFFRDGKYVSRLLTVMSRLDFPEVIDWYGDHFDFALLPRPMLTEWLDSIMCHANPKSMPLLDRLGDLLFLPDDSLREQTLFEKWLEALALSQPDASKGFNQLIGSPRYAKLGPQDRIAVINHIVNHALIFQADRECLNGAGRLLAQLLKDEKDVSVQGRLLRAFAQVGVRLESAANFVKQNVTNPNLAPSCMVFLESLPHRKALALLSDTLGTPISDLVPVGLLKALQAQEQMLEDPRLDEFLRSALSSGASIELRIAALQLLTRHRRPELLAEVLRCLAGEERLQLAGIIALKTFQMEEAASAIGKFLNHGNPSIVGRALDTLTALPGLPAKVIVIELLRDHPEDYELCDKIIRCLQPPESESEFFVDILDGILRKYPNHPQTDGLIDLRERVASGPKPKRNTGPSSSVPDGGLIDESISKSIPSFTRFDDCVKSVLRSAELPFVHKEIFEGSVDKSTSIVGFCKSLEIFFERQIGRRWFFPRLETSLHEFQNLIHAATLNEESPNPDRVLKQLALDKAFTAESLPLHKMSQISRGILTGKILDDRFKVMDGLRAWAVLLLMFSRNGERPERVVAPLGELGNAQIIDISKRLMLLQDIRNPAAHRQTFLEFIGVDEVRREVFRLLHELEGANSGSPRK